MQHPSKDAIYCLSYPRSGSNWFRYCFKYITETNIDKELLFHSHGTANDRWTLENTFDVKSILLLRNYKECIISEIKNVYMRSPEELNERCIETFGQCLPGMSASSAEVLERLLFTLPNFIAIVKHMALHFDPALHRLTSDDWGRRFEEYDKPGYHNPALKLMDAEVDGKSPFQVARAFDAFMGDSYYSMKAEIDKVFGDFVLSDFPLFGSDYVENVEISRYPIESVLSMSASNHYHFAMQLVRYYELLEYHDRVFKANPNNTLLVKYEDFIEDSFTELSKVVDFMEQTRLATSDRINMFRGNLHKLVDDIEPHKAISMTKYRNRPEARTGFLAHSYRKDPDYNFHSSICRKEFLIKIDNVLKNKNLELYNQYLSDYEEKAD